MLLKSTEPAILQNACPRCTTPPKNLKPKNFNKNEAF